MRFLTLLTALVAAATLVAMTAHASAHASAGQAWTRAAGLARSAACPLEGQCAVDPKTGCPLGGPSSGAHPASPAPIKVALPLRCVAVPTTVFYRRASTAAGCNEVLFVQVKLQPGITQYESVVYSTLGEGTRWWADPSTPLDQTGPATKAGHTFTYGAVSYTVPQGYLAWDVGGGSGGDPNGCNDPSPPPFVLGWGGWGVKGAAAVGGGGSIHVQGPTHIAFHHSFVQSITGTTGTGADYVQSGEQLGWARCASTLIAEQTRSGWTPWPSGTGAVHGSFHLVARFYARNRLRHAICSYLVNWSTKQTYAHAANYWSNA